MSFSALAAMPVYNEADILPWVVKHLVSQGIQVYAIDNWSTDGSWEMLPSLPLVGYERFPKEGPTKLFECRRLLKHIDEGLASAPMDWCLFHDADEIRRSPYTGESLLEAFQRVQTEGYNAVDHQLYKFVPTDDNYAGDPENHFRYYDARHSDSRIRHVKAWKNVHRVVGLGEWHAGGGHNAKYRNWRITPERFILKHYPIRSQRHGEEKLADRMHRWDPVERARGWHIQYEGMTPPYRFVRDPTELCRWIDGTPNVAIVTMAKYPDVFAHLRRSIDQHEPRWGQKIVVVDGDIGLDAPGWRVVRGPQPFAFTRNFNLGVAAVEGVCDVLYLNDDVSFLGAGSIDKLREVAHERSDIGILSPLIEGAVGNPLQSATTDLKSLTYSDTGLAFVCVYIKSEVLAKVQMDTRFTGYGEDDLDYCWQAQRLGWKLAVTPLVRVKHGLGDHKASVTWLRSVGVEKQLASMREMKQLREEKLRAVATRAVRLNIGCSDDLRQGYINVDLVEPADVLVDLNQRWPWADGTISEIRAYDILEHLRSPVFTMNEAYRILKPGGKFDIVVPTTDGLGWAQDPNHLCYPPWNRNSFHYYTHGNIHRERFGRAYGIQARFNPIQEEVINRDGNAAALHITLEAVRPGTVSLLYLARNRLEYTRESLATLRHNTDWGLVTRLVLWDDGSTDGTADYLKSMGTKLGAAVVKTNHGVPFLAANDFIRRTMGDSDYLVKIDNDAIVSPCWLGIALGIMYRNPELDILGLEPVAGATVDTDDFTYSYKRVPDCGGLFVARRRAFEEKELPQPYKVYHGWQDWQRKQNLVVATVCPSIRLFLLDRLPFEPWLGWGKEYEAKGWQRPWQHYTDADASLWKGHRWALRS